MPKIPQNALDSIFYLYPTREDAKKGTNFGGTGFLIYVPSEIHGKYGRGYIYGVTNWHVACQGSSVIRLNTKTTTPHILDYGPDLWFFDPRYDVAVTGIKIDAGLHRTTQLHDSMLLTQEAKKKAAEIGPGDDVFMVGRFIDHDGGDSNLPAVRFGHISIDPSRIEQPNGRKAHCYCIDLHSRTGYSGSPVFVYRTPGSDLSVSNDPQSPKLLLAGTSFFMLLGIHCAQFPELWEVTAEGKLRHESGEPLLTGGRYIRGYSGMTVVIPSWVIREVLDMPILKEWRRNGDEQTEKMFKQNGYPPVAENASPSAAPRAADESPKG
jgi:hypothetical protein